MYTPLSFFIRPCNNNHKCIKNIVGVINLCKTLKTIIKLSFVYLSIIFIYNTIYSVTQKRFKDG